MTPAPYKTTLMRLGLIALLAVMLPSHADPAPRPNTLSITDDELVSELPGFRSEVKQVNGVRLHYVIGGRGTPVVLLPGWPQTWWSYHKIMPSLAARHTVVAVDIRGMGASDKPDVGYDKKTMAQDIHELVLALGYRRAHIVGHDIGAQVAWSFAANYPSATRSLTMLDVPHPDDGLLQWPLLPKHGTFTDEIDEKNAYAWWFAFHQVKGLPEQLLEGRAELEHEWFFKYLAYRESAIDARDRAVYAAAYNQPGGVRAGNAWYQAFTQDIVDQRGYKPVQVPVLGIAGPGFDWLRSVLAAKAPNSETVKIPESGHFLVEEAPDETLRLLLPFLTKNDDSRR